MGSSSNRKVSDSPIIQRPENANKGEGTGGGSRGLPERVAQVCIPSFEKEIQENPVVKDGEIASLSKNNDGDYEVVISSKTVATLDKKLSEMIDACQEMGIGYLGKVVKQKNKFYARFSRTP